MFSYKDQRFGCLSRAAGVLLHNLPYIQMFLDENPHINNRLVRSVYSVVLYYITLNFP